MNLYFVCYVLLFFSLLIEKVAWSLDRMGIEYVREDHHCFLGMLLGGSFVPVLEVGPYTKIMESSHILKFLFGMWPEKAEFLDPSDEESRQLVNEFDVLAVHVARYLYYHIFNVSDPSLLERLWMTGIPAHEKLLGKFMLLPVAAAAIKYILKINKCNMERSREKVREGFRKISDRLSDGRKYLMGDKFTYVDLCFSSVCGPAVFPGKSIF